MIDWLLAPILGMYFSVVPSHETAPSPYPEDSVDDAVVWYNANQPADSLVLVTLKASNQRPVLATGILVYDLEGKQKQFLQGGTPNNIDARTGFETATETFTLIVASHWWSNEVGLYRVDPETLTLEPIKLFNTSLTRLRGICAANFDNKYYYYAVSENGELEQYLVAKDLTSVSLVAKRKLDSSAEGCVVDDEQKALYVAEESQGIWRYSANLADDKPPKMIAGTSFLGPLKRDIEGLELIRTSNTGGYLVASSQGADKLVVYDRTSNDYIAEFDISAHLGIDAVTGTDGIAASTAALGEHFPEGIFIAQDNVNTEGEAILNQNFKYVPLENILTKLQRLEDER